MSVAYIVLVLVVGIALGAALVAFPLTARARQALEAALGEARASAELRARAERAALETRLAERDQQLAAERSESARRDARAEAALKEAADEARREGERAAALAATLTEERRAAAEKAALLDAAQARLSDAFKALSAEALQAQGRQFLELAQTSLEKFQQSAQGDLGLRQKAIAELVAPVKETVTKLGERLGEMEKARVGAYAELREQVRSMGEAQGMLRQEAGKLVQALRAPAVRGRWGEMQLRRVVELAGMQEHCDFDEQATVAATGSAARLRPDLVVRLPGGKCLAVDAKAPLKAYLDAIEAVDEPARRAHFVDHARQIGAHVAKLAHKAYYEHLPQTPEFVVLFIPGESFFAAALEQDPSLIETAAETGVVLATPTTLIALLKAVAYGWQQEVIAESARAIRDLGRELHDRVATMGEHAQRLGKSLGRSVEAYNDFVGSLETRVLPSARKLKDLQAASPSSQIPSLADVEELPRTLHAPELALGN